MFARIQCPHCEKRLMVFFKRKEEHKELDVLETQREAAPETAEHDPQDGCENLASPPWRKRDFTKNLGNEETE